MANRLTKTAVASSNAQQVNPVHVVQKPKKETSEFDNGALQENKTADVSEKKNGINLTLVPPRQQPAAEKIKTASVENIITKGEAKEKESQQELQSLVLQPDTSFAIPRAEAELNNSQQAKSHGLLTEDSASSLEKGQMRKTTFLELLRAEITKTIEPVLKTVGQTTKDCPYMNYWLDLYHQKDAEHIERTVKKYAPDSIGAIGAREYIAIVTQRALHAAVIWAKTGRLSGIPPGVPTAIPGQAPTPSGSAVLTKAKTGGARVTDDQHAIQEQLGEGQPLSSNVRSRMESAFGTDLSHVRTHTASNAGEISNRVNARAFTIGNHVGFATGEYKPGTLFGDALIAHEIAHVIQQNQNHDATLATQNIGTQNNDQLEREADHASFGFVISQFTRFKQISGKFKSVIPRLKSGLKLSRCSSTEEVPQFEQNLQPEDKGALVEYKRLLEEGRINQADKLEVDHKIHRAEIAIRSAKEIAEKGGSSGTVAGGSIGAVGVLAADDATGIGVADDVAIPFVLIVAAGAALVSYLRRASPDEIAEKGREAVRDVEAVMEAIRRINDKTKKGPDKKPDPKPEPIDPVPPIPDDKERQDANAMRFQVQWDSKNKGPIFSEIALAPKSVGVTTTQAIPALYAALNKVTPEKAKEAARPAAAKQEKWILSRPPSGIATGGYSHSEYFAYKGYTDSRVDVENLRGHNLKS